MQSQRILKCSFALICNVLQLGNAFATAVNQLIISVGKRLLPFILVVFYDFTFFLLYRLKKAEQVYF